MNADYYAVYAEHEMTHWWFVWRARIVEEFLANATTGPDWQILDAGCGTGGVLSRAAAFGDVCGIDFSPLALEFAQSRGLDRLLLGHVEELPFKPAVFDCALALDVIEHVDNDRAALSELSRVLKPGGMLIVTVPAYQWLWSEHDVTNQHRRRYSLSEMRSLIEAAGLEIQVFTGINSLALPGVAAIRKAKNAGHRIYPATDSNGAGSHSYDLRHYPKQLNEALTWAAGLENAIWKRRSIPFGVSILAVAKKPE